MKRTYNYNIHNILSISSAQRLPELKFFLSDKANTPADIEVFIDRQPAKYKKASSICYHDFGTIGFNIVINRTDLQTEVVVSPLIGLSPHVLYTNVIEPLIRWNLVRKGYALMHGACLEFGDKALFITAQTDTGKTTTVLHTLRHNLKTCRFLSDDMTIFCPNGDVLSYPKPLTISQHTVQAVGGAPLTLREKLFLKIQSRLHSRGGRKIGMQLSDSSFPAATLNAIVQWLIPPPKFHVDYLIPGAQLGKSSRLTALALIERGPDFEGPLSDDEKIDTLISNAEDAYGFPPYPLLADALSSWQGKDLHEQEREIVKHVVADIPAIRLASPRYDWYLRLPALVSHAAPQRGTAVARGMVQPTPNVLPAQ
jgi:dolichol-phosphate mannosyltransferase